MKIRKMIAADYEQVKALQVQIINSHIKGSPENFKKTNHPLDYDFFLSMLQEENINYVCEQDGEIVGVINATPKSPSKVPFVKKRKILNIDSIIVKNGFQRLGIGKKLFKKVEDVAKKQNYEAILLNVWSFNKSAISFYEAQGMTCQSMKFEKKLN